MIFFPGSLVRFEIYWAFVREGEWMKSFNILFEKNFWKINKIIINFSYQWPHFNGDAFSTGNVSNNWLAIMKKITRRGSGESLHLKIKLINYVNKGKYLLSCVIPAVTFVNLKKKIFQREAKNSFCDFLNIISDR